MQLDIPKISPDGIPHAVLERWLDRHAQVPLRLVAGPPASGKTTAVGLWARARRDRRAWITLSPGATKVELCAMLLCVLAPRNAATLHDALSTSTKTEIVIDGADAADPGAREFLARLYAEAPERTTFIYLVRSAGALDLLRGMSGGIATVFDGSLLRMSDEQVEALCSIHKITSKAPERLRLVHEAGGWAMAVAGSIRYAAGVGAPLDTAFVRWLESSRSFLGQLVEDALRAAPVSAADLFHRVMDGGARDLPLHELAEAGLFVDQIDGEYQFNPVIRSIGPSSQRVAMGPAIVHMFGRFRVTIGDQEVEFVRRRDRQILQYLALHQDGAATRAALLRVFWPDSEPQLAAQALRTACSTIRRSFAACVGRGAVDSYFRSESAVLRLRLDNMLNTADRFRAHVDSASAADEEGRTDAAFAHWAAAVRLHVSPLLSGEPPAEWIDDYQREFEQLAAIAQKRYNDLNTVALAATEVRGIA